MNLKCSSIYFNIYINYNQFSKIIGIDSKSLEYYHPSFSTPERLYFVAFLPDVEEGARRYHIHLTYFGSGEWKELIEFRDYLLNSPEAVKEYAELKKRAALEADEDGEKYRKIKEPIFKKRK